jgi:hypothetical protein
MDYAEWEKYRGELQNGEMRIFRRLSDETRKAMRAAQDAGAPMHVLSFGAMWENVGQVSFAEGLVYRISPDWPGPAKPEPKTEYVDESIHTSGGMYVLYHHSGCVLWLCDAQNNVAFAGYVYEINGVDSYHPRLMFDTHTDGTCRLRVPKAVRFVKGAV